MKVKSINVRYALYCAFAIAALFFGIKIFGLEEYSILRVLNIFIVFLFSNALIKKISMNNESVNYLEGLSSIFIMNFITTMISVLGFSLYVVLFDSNFLNRVDGGLLWPKGIHLAQASSALFLEGIAGSVIVSFILMQYWKDFKNELKKI